MDCFIDTDNLAVLDAGTLRNGLPYRIVLLTPAQAPLCAALHAETIAGLAEDQKTYMFPKDAAYFAAQMQKGGGNAVLGVVSGGQLVAQAMIRHPDAAHPETGMVDMTLPGPPEALSLLQAVSVAPPARGAGIMELLVHQWVLHAAGHGRDHLLAEIHVDNAASWASFLRGGLNLVSIGTDPADGTQVYNAYERTGAVLEKSLTAEFNRYAGCPAAECAAADRDGQKALMARGYVIAGRTADKAALVLRQVGAPAP